MANVAIPKGEITVDDRGRVTGLNRVRSVRYTRYQAEEGAGGVITLTPIITMTPAELSDLERAREALRAGDAATAAYLLGVPRADVERVAGAAS